MACSTCNSARQTRAEEIPHAIRTIACRPTLWLFLHCAAAATAAAQNPFAGTWKLNQEKSQLAGDTMKFGPAAGAGDRADRRGNHLLLSRGRQDLCDALRQRRHLETDQRR